MAIEKKYGAFVWKYSLYYLFIFTNSYENEL
jgi:hypothetical protein